MKILGLTGAMGAGKSTISKMFTALGAVVIDADDLAKQVVEPKEPANLAIKEAFGAEYFLSDGHLDRKRMADLVFQDPEKLALLNKITHQAIHLLRAQIFETLFHKDPDTTVIYAVPLLFEVKMQNSFQRVMMVTIDPEIQMQRLVQKRGFTIAEAQARLKNQMKQEQKIALSDYLIDNSGKLEESRTQVAMLWNKIESLPILGKEFMEYQRHDL